MPIFICLCLQTVSRVLALEETRITRWRGEGRIRGMQEMKKIEGGGEARGEL